MPHDVVLELDRDVQEDQPGVRLVMASLVAGEFLGSERISQLTEAAGGSLDGTPHKAVVRVPLGGNETATSDVIREWEAVLGTATDQSLREAERRADAVSGDDVAAHHQRRGPDGRALAQA